MKILILATLYAIGVSIYVGYTAHQLHKEAVVILNQKDL